jgi:hypothetical protein
VNPSCAVTKLMEALGRRREAPYRSADPAIRVAKSPSLADSVLGAVLLVRERTGLDIVAPSGGVFQNVVLLERVALRRQDPLRHAHSLSTSRRALFKGVPSDQRLHRGVGGPAHPGRCDHPQATAHPKRSPLPRSRCRSDVACPTGRVQPPGTQI